MGRNGNAGSDIALIHESISVLDEEWISDRAAFSAPSTVVNAFFQMLAISVTVGSLRFTCTPFVTPNVGANQPKHPDAKRMDAEVWLSDLLGAVMQLISSSLTPCLFVDDAIDEKSGEASFKHCSAKPEECSVNAFTDILSASPTTMFFVFDPFLSNSSHANNSTAIEFVKMQLLLTALNSGLDSML